MKKHFLLFMLMVVSLTMTAQRSPKNTMVEIKTSLGDIKIMLYDETPQHRDNFIKLVNEGFYEGTLFHRVIKEFMIQAGDPDSRDAAPEKRLGAGGPGYTIPAEILCPQFYHKRGALAAARQGDQVNPDRKSSGSQFYIVDGKTFSDQELDAIERRVGMSMRSADPFKYSDEQRLTYKTLGGSPHLDGQYTVFGEVVDGFDVLQKIADAKTQPGDRPVNDIKIISAKVVKR